MNHLYSWGPMTPASGCDTAHVQLQKVDSIVHLHCTMTRA